MWQDNKASENKITKNVNKRNIFLKKNVDSFVVFIKKSVLHSFTLNLMLKSYDFRRIFIFLSFDIFFPFICVTFQIFAHIHKHSTRFYFRFILFACFVLFFFCDTVDKFDAKNTIENTVRKRSSSSVFIDIFWCCVRTIKYCHTLSFCIIIGCYSTQRKSFCLWQCNKAARFTRDYKRLMQLS